MTEEYVFKGFYPDEGLTRDAFEKEVFEGYDFGCIFADDIKQAESIAAEVVKERLFGIAKFGGVDGANLDPHFNFSIITEEFLEAAKDLLANRPHLHREELIQVAACCLKAVACIDHRFKTEMAPVPVGNREEELEAILNPEDPIPF